MKVVTDLAELSVDELRRVRETLRKRFGFRRSRNLLDIGFGIAERDDKPDTSRPSAVCFYVRRKLRRASPRIPQVAKVRVKRGQHFAEVRLPTDVLQVGKHARLTGRAIRHTESSAVATAGGIIAWRIKNHSTVFWGVLTVGHLFAARNALPESPRSVRIACGPDRWIAGRLLARSDQRDGFRVDAALVLVVKSTLVRAQLIPGDFRPQGKQLRSLNDLKTDIGRNGHTYPDAIPLPFHVGRYLPETELFREVGPIAHVFEAHSEQADTFGMGRSGSLWILRRQAACLQFGGWDTPGNPRTRFQRGVGQCLQTIFDWGRLQLAELHHVKPTQLDLRFLREL
ncbi:MAG: hypothetical protein KDA60_10295 [Planctomycetales bacterium]|nr:hypothetical protein [Planctomycetales bacterium]